MAENARRRWTGYIAAMAGVFAAAPGWCAIPSKPVAYASAWGNQGDGTYVNPVLPADYSDIDAIRVGNDYYAISSTFQYSPGVIILRSKDLVSWEIAGHAVTDLTQIGPEMNWDRMARYGRGIWAGAIRFHEGKFWLYFGTPDEGFFMTTAPAASGPWAPLTQVMTATGWDDCCPFWDTDGQGYFVCTHTAGGYKIHLFKMTADGKALVPESDQVIHQSRGSEANKLLKINGVYYHFFSEVKGEGRVAMMERASSLAGPWEIKQLNHVNKRIDREPNQGGLVEGGAGKWWFLTHQGTGDWEGRALVLLPVEWVEGWPMLGKPGADGIGEMVWRSEVPVAGVAVSWPKGSDDFDSSELGAQWEWNYQPRAGKWSLTERPGFLRLHAFVPLGKGDLLKAGNTLTQRVMRTASNEVLVKMDVGGMADGERAGVCHLAKNYSWVGVVQRGATRVVVCNERRKESDGPALIGREVWLKSSWGVDGMSHYAVSVDGEKFSPIGEPYALSWSYYRGDRIGVFNFNDVDEAGYVDVDFVHCQWEPPAGARGEK